MELLLKGIIIFVARICDVSIGTVRTIAIIQGRTVLAFFLGFMEIIIWITVAGAVINDINKTPVLVLFYALGYATGNVVGIIVERKLAFGMIILRVITVKKGKEMAERLRKTGQPVTTFIGEGMQGPVMELYVACRRRDLRWLLPIVKEEEPNAFYITEQARDVSKILRPFNFRVTGWRAVSKRK